MEADSDLLSQSPAAEPAAPARTVFISADLDAAKFLVALSGAFEDTSEVTGRGWKVISMPPYDIPGETIEDFGFAIQGIEAAVLVISPGYLRSRQTIKVEYPVLLRREAEDGLPVFRVLAVDVPPSESGPLALDRHPLYNAKPLADMEVVERRDALASLVTAVGRAVDRQKGVPQPARSQAGSAAAHIAAAERSLAGAGDVQGYLARYRMSGAVRQILVRAAEYAAAASQLIPVSTDLLLLVLAEAGAGGDAGEWTAPWLREALAGAGLKDIRTQAIEWYGITLPGPGAERAAGLSEGAALALDSAAEIARRTTGSDEIHARHLLAALLTDRRGPAASGALMVLGDWGLGPDALCKDFFEQVRRQEGDDEAAWSLVLLGREIRVYRMAGFHADDTRGEDLLGIQQDVLAFATLVAARTVTPPLSIGLFGEWGSGKSFFMRHLRRAVEGLAADAARSGRMQRDLPFYKRIVQIEFNAWHYVEGNLWASLVEHIFRNLRVPGETASETLQKVLKQDLKFAEQIRAEADAERSRAQAEVENAHDQVTAAREEHERQREELAKQAATQAEDELTRDEVWNAVRPVLERLGLSRTAQSAREALEALAEARAVVERGSRVFLPLIQAPPGERRRRTRLLLLVLFLGPAVAWLVGVAVDAVGDAALAQLTALASGAAALLTAGAAWVRSQVSWASNRVAEVEKANREVDRLLAGKQAEQAGRLRELEQRLQLARADYEAALQRQSQAEARVREAEARLDETSVARLLASFIEDRAASADYRKHLGVLALVRNDFETLSGLIEEENWHLSPDGHDDGRYPGRTRFATPEQEARSAAGRINRIVLYIDDLDRCPPNKVVEVLQAVHLLLAFPLFVVVVGVDARWVKRSLEVRYRELLHEGGARANSGSEGLLIGSATTDDYLEKIFQVPFWLRPMDEQRTAGMVRGLLAGSVARGPSPPAGLPSGAARARHPAPAPSSDGRAGAPADGRTTPDPAAGPDAVGVDAIVREPEPAAVVEEPQVNLESLEFRPEELDFMTALAPLLDRSPRALKRFVNVYRLIKAGLTWEEQRAFYDAGEQAPPPYQVVLFLLAVDTGLPQLAESFFTALYPQRPLKGFPVPDYAPGATLTQLVQHSTMGGGGVRWPHLAAWMRTNIGEEPRFDPPLALLTAWEPRVTRFSFRANA